MAKPRKKPASRKAVPAAVPAHIESRHRRMESRLRLSQTLYHSLVENIPQCMLRKDVRGRFIFANRRFCNALGKPRREVLGKTDYDFYPKAMADKFRKDDIIVMETGEIFETEEANQSPGQPTHYVRVVKTPLRDHDGKIIGVQVIFWDVSERRLAEEALNEQSKLMDILMGTVPDLIFFKDLEGRFLRINRALAVRYGLPDADAAVGKTDFDFYPREEAERFRRDEQEILSSGKPLVNHEERKTCPDGRVVWTATTKMPLHDKGGRLIGIFGIAHDITALKTAETNLAEQASLMDSLMDNVPDYIYFKDLQSRFTRVSRAQATRFGLKDPDGAVGKTDCDFFTREHAEPALRDEQEILRTGRPIVSKEEKETFPDGTEKWVSTTKMPVRDREGRIVGTFGISHDITGLKVAEQALAEQADLLNTLMDNVPDRIFFKDAKSRFLRVNRAQAARFGLRDPAEAVGKTDFDFFPREEAERFLQDEQAIMSTGNPMIGKEEKRTLPDGTVAWTSSTKLPLRDRAGRVVGTFGINRDITGLKCAEEQLVHQAFYDPLVQLPNRALFMDRLGHRFRRARRDADAPFAILFLDLDRFKGVNDSLGHEAGDNLLVTIARRLETCVRPGDTVARLGGDEFTLLIDEVADGSDAVRIAERIQAALAASCNLAGVEVFTTVSIGIALSSTGYERPEDMLRDADTAMYRAKAHGRARHEIFDAAMHERAVNLLQLETDLRHAVERNEFRIFYQPVVTVSENRLTGFEALVRWQHPQRGLLQPDAFIPLAEETGLINPIGLWVLREASRQTHEWQARFPFTPPLRISVNVSARQFAQKDFVEQLRRILGETGLDPSTLTLEITESAIIENIKATTAILGQIRALSIQLYIDDFGTGYSSLSQLQHFPIDTLKVDRSFVRTMRADGDQAEIVRTIVSLAQNLGMNVTAEGVETAEQLEALRKLQCGSAQGFFFSEPLDAASAEALLSRGPHWHGRTEG